MVRNLPLRIDNRRLPHLNDTIARGEARLSAGAYKINVRPLIPVIMDVIGDLAEQDAFID